jgi:hypothetical protein
MLPRQGRIRPGCATELGRVGERRLDRGFHASALPALRLVQAARRAPIYLANSWRILNQLADDPIVHLGVLMEAPSDR